MERYGKCIGRLKRFLSSSWTLRLQWETCQPAADSGWVWWCYKNQNPTMCHHVTIFHTSNFSKEDKVHHNFWGALQTLSRVQVLPRYADTCEPIEGQVTAIPTPNGKGSSHRITSFPSEFITRSNGSTPKLIPCTGYAISMKLQESYVKHEQHINLSYISVA